MLKFICYECDEEYDAKSRSLGVEYFDLEGKHIVLNDNEPCYKCELLAENAKEQALAKKRKRV